MSPSTFFRYFPSKEMVLMANDLDHVTIEALGQQPADMPSSQAFRRALEITMATLSEDEWRFERARLRMVLSIPELKAAQFDEYRRTVAALAEANNSMEWIRGCLSSSWCGTERSHGRSRATAIDEPAAAD